MRILMRILRWLGTVLKYAAGVLCWLLVFGLLAQYCIFDVYSRVDRLWVKDLHGGLVRNLIGEVALHVGAGGCDDHYIYTLRYHPTRLEIEGEHRSLSSLVDVATWKETGADSITVTYLDKKHRYVLYSISDGTFLKAVDR